MQAERTAQREAEALESEKAAALVREQTAQAEAAAQAAEEYAPLSPRERNVRRVARMLLVANPGATRDYEINPEAVPLATIQEELSVSRTTTGELRQEALALIGGGYRITGQEHRA
jgi:hypothetical protein